jgi:hypothetical protein
MRRFALTALAASAIIVFVSAGPLEAAPAGAWTVESFGSVGFNTAGGGVGVYYSVPFGATLGLSTRASVPLFLDPITGLADFFQMYLSPLAEAGWELSLPLGFALSVQLFAGAELSFLTERIVDPSHSIDRGYSDFGMIFDSGVSFTARWMFMERMGVRLSLQLSFYDLRKSTASLGCVFGI